MTTEREVIAFLKERYQDASTKLEKAGLALEAYGVDPTSIKTHQGGASPSSVRSSSSSRRKVRKTRPRIVDGAGVEAEMIRVLESANEPLTAREIFDRGNFECSPSAIPHAANRRSDIESSVVQDGGRSKRFFALKAATPSRHPIH